MNSNDVSALFATALRHHQAGELAEAERLYREALARDPEHADSLHLLGMLGYQCGHPEAAGKLILQAISLHPEVALYHSNLGVVLNSLGKLDMAVESYQRAIALKPDYVEAHSNMANTLVSQGKLDNAMPHFKRVLTLNPDHADSHVNLGVALAEQGNTVEAIAHYQRAISINPQCAEAFSNLGNALQTQDRLEEAIVCYERALTMKPDYLTALYNYGNACVALNRLDQAMDCYNRALTFQPDYAHAVYGKALAQLLRGQFVTGWRNYEARWRTEGHKPMRAYSQTRWQGERLASGNLLIWPEQGIGDEIMFAGLIPDVVRTGNSCVLECDARLRPLFARSFPTVTVVSAQESAFAAHQPIGSLPGLFRSALTSFAATISPYLAADPEQRQLFRSRYQCGKLLVGIAWHTKNPKTGPSRCMNLSLLAPLFRRTDVLWVSLQYGNHDELQKSIDTADAPIWIDRRVDQMVDMDAFAAQIAALDLVITIDNSTAHLAGGLGVPVWVMLPFARDWRWLQSRPDSPWYPDMRLFRQPRNGDWLSVVDSVASALETSYGSSTTRSGIGTGLLFNESTVEAKFNPS